MVDTHARTVKLRNWPNRLFAYYGMGSKTIRQGVTVVCVVKIHIFTQFPYRSIIDFHLLMEASRITIRKGTFFPAIQI